MKHYLLSLLLFAGAAHGTDPDPEAPSENEALRKQIVALDDRVARLETMTSLLMTAYQAEIKRQSLEREIMPPPPLPSDKFPPIPELQEVRP